jgi:lysyl-tRNA synthetase class 1
MRWAYEKVDFEPAGKDHHSQGGSFDTAKQVVKQVFHGEAPVSFRYDFIGTKGSPGKMSSSSGNVITIGTVLNVYTPEVARYLFASKIPQTEFSISFDLDVIKIYEDYDRCERIALGVEPSKDAAAWHRERRIWELSQVDQVTPLDTPPNDNITSPSLQEGQRDALTSPPLREGQCGTPTSPPLRGGQRGGYGMPLFQAPFRHLCNLVQIHGGDIEATLDWFKTNGMGGLYPTDADAERIRERAKCAWYWATECAEASGNADFCFSLCEAGTKAALNEAETRGLQVLRDTVVAKLESFTTDKDCQQAIYDAAEAAGLPGKDGSKTLFRAAYQALIGKDQGPRLANFLRTIDKERLLGILGAY